jgi:hypothetical protein
MILTVACQIPGGYYRVNDLTIAPLKKKTENRSRFIVSPYAHEQYQTQD